MTNTLKQFVDKYEGWQPELDIGYPVAHLLYDLVTDVFTDGEGWEAPTTIPASELIANKLFCIYICPQFKNTRLAHEDKDFFRYFLLILNRTFDRYKTVIEGFEANKTKLLDDIKVATETKFNDTPQNIQGTYDWSDDDHLTNVSRTESTNPIATKMARIDEITRLIEDYYNKWLHEFDRLFLIGG